LSRSTIFGFESFAVRPGKLRAPMLALALLVAAELGLRALAASPAHEYPRNWHAQDVNHKLALADRLAAEGGIEVLALGQSVMESGFDPSLLGGSDARAFNFALNGTTANFQARFIERVLLPRYAPKTLVWGFTPGAFSEALHTKQFEKVLGGPSERALHDGGLGGRLDYALQQHLALVYYRNNLRAWFGVVTAPSSSEEAARVRERWSLSEEQYELMRSWRAFLPRGEFRVNDLGYRPQRGVFGRTAPADLEAARRRFEGMSVDEAWVAPVRDAILSCRERGVRVLLVDLPAAPGWELQLPDGRLDEHRRVLEQVAEETGAELLDLVRLDEARYPTELYADSLHFNVEGAERFTREVQAFLETN
jgi:hypothetical protein